MLELAVRRKQIEFVPSWMDVNLEKLLTEKHNIVLWGGNFYTPLWGCVEKPPAAIQ